MTCPAELIVNGAHTRRRNTPTHVVDQHDAHLHHCLNLVDPCLNLQDPDTIAGIQAGIAAVLIQQPPHPALTSQTQNLLTAAAGLRGHTVYRIRIPNPRTLITRWLTRL